MSTPAPEPIRLSKVLFERGVARYETALNNLLAHLNEECPLDEDGREAYVAQVTSLVVSIICVVVSFRD